MVVEVAHSQEQLKLFDLERLATVGVFCVAQV